MSSWQNIKQSVLRILRKGNLRNFISSPVTQIIGINTAMFMLWRIQGLQSFLIRNFAFERQNIQQNRYYTMVTYAFSHFSFVSYFINMVVIASFGKAIRLQFNKKIIWYLYLLGAGFGGITMHLGMPNAPMIIPQIGADAAATALMTFYGLFNMQQTVMLFFIPVRMWILLGLLGAYCLYEPSRKNLGGAFAALLGYRLFKMKII